MPLKSIAFAIPGKTSDVHADHTPAELPSGRVRFSDELGRETALAASRERRGTAPVETKSRSARSASSDAPPATSETGDASDDAEAANTDAAANDPSAPALPNGSGPRSGARARPGARAISIPSAKTGGKALPDRVAPKSDGDDDEIALALAALGLSVTPASEAPAVPLTLLDASARSSASESIAEVGAASEGVDGSAASDAGLAPGVSGFGRDALVDASRTGDGDESVSGSKGLVGELLRAATAKTTRTAEAEAAATPAAGVASNPLDPFHPLLAHADLSPDVAKAVHAASEAKAPPIDAATATDRAPETAEALPRVALSDVPHALPALLDRLAPEMRFGRRGKNWEVELRLDPPELGALRFRIEMRGDEIRGVVQCEPRVERLLGPVLKDLEENLRQHGGGASFDLQREARGEERPSAPWATSTGAIPDAAAGPRASSRSAADPSRLVDVTA